MSSNSIRITPTEAQKRLVAGRQSFKCANNSNVILKGIENYKCPLWLKSDSDNKGSFDQSGYELDHINELSVSGDNSLDNFQALCKSCHCVKTKNFLMKKTNTLYHPIYGKLILKQGLHKIYLADSHIITRNSNIWSKNRTPDILRIKEIMNYIESNNFVDGILFLANIQDEGLVCYDGNHRREALKMLDKSYKIFVNVIENPTLKYLCDKFTSLNKCVPKTELLLQSEINKDKVNDNINDYDNLEDKVRDDIIKSVNETYLDISENNSKEKIKKSTRKICPLPSCSFMRANKNSMLKHLGLKEGESGNCSSSYFNKDIVKKCFRYSDSNVNNKDSKYNKAKIILDNIDDILDELFT